MRQRAFFASLLAVTAATIAHGQESPQSPPEPGARFRDCPDCPEMIVIPAGRFVMGSPQTEKDRFPQEWPEHPVTIARPFAMAVDAVTRAEYAEFVRATGRPDGTACKIYDAKYHAPNGSQLRIAEGKNWRDPAFAQTDQDPVVCISWDDAQAYIAWLNARAGGSGGGRYRLPTEAEWEYAARAGATTPYYWGEEISRDRVNYGLDEKKFAPFAKGADRWLYTSPVGSFPANPFGLHDMAGNVWQMVEDCWHGSYVLAPRDGSAWMSDTCKDRVVRGGSWYKPPTGQRHAMRGKNTAEDMRHGLSEIGFRVVRSLD